MDRCIKCGAPVPAYYVSQGFCDDCKWDTWIPRGHEVREGYAMDVVWGHLNATRRPPLGVEFLDRAGPALSVRLPMCERKPSKRKAI